MKVAIIGTRNPSNEQISFINNFINSLYLKHGKELIIHSGCADGIDKIGLERGHELKIETIGFIPWYSYNTHVHEYCSKISTLSTIDVKAFESVDKYHPAPQYLSQGARKLHARNYNIIVDCDLVLAAPSQSVGLGGTGQGIRIALGLNIPLIVINHIGGTIEANNFSDIVSFINN